jgi:hypothetical protein
MKVSRVLTLLLGSSLLFAVSAFAGNTNNTNKKSLHLFENATIQGIQLPAGDYKCEWSGSGPDVKVTILKDRDAVATVPAQIVSQGASNEQDGYALVPGKDGSQSITDIFFSGEKFNLKIDQASNSSGAN